MSDNLDDDTKDVDATEVDTSHAATQLPASEEEIESVEAPPDPPSGGVRSGQGSVTERNWDGWPTKETPDYLIPRMGEVPVSSTVHFQSVSMTSMDDGLSAGEMWHKLREPLLTALREKARREGGRLTIKKAVYGDFDAPLKSYPKSLPLNVTDQVAQMTAGGERDIQVTNRTFGDPAPRARKHLHVDYIYQGQHLFKRAANGVKLRLPGELEILKVDLVGDQRVIAEAAIGELDQDQLIEGLTTHVRSMVRNHQVTIQANTLWQEFVRNKIGAVTRIARRFFRLVRAQHVTMLVRYSIDGVQHQKELIDDQQTVIGSELKIARAVYGELSPERTIDATQAVASHIDDGKISLEVRNDAMGFDPAHGIVKTLVVDYSTAGKDKRVVVAEYETLSIAAEQFSIDPSDVFAQYFDPEPDSIGQLARRLSKAGLDPTDIAGSTAYDSMEDELKKLLGIDEEARFDPLENAEPDAMDAPAEGVILYHEQGWYGRGLALGNLLHSVALAPGEVTQVAMTHWNHSTRASSSESISQRDTASASDSQNRSVSEIQDSALREHQSGSSKGDSLGISMANATSSTTTKGSLDTGFLGGIGSFFGVGDGPSASMTTTGSSSSFGLSHNVSSVVTRSTGDKSLAMESNQKINAATKRHSEAARTRRASVVREVSQSEEETLTTRVVANYNHMHALTMMYFEVIEVFSLKTKVVDAERVIFLPFKVRDVNDLIPKYRAVLVDAANSVRAYDLAEAIRSYQGDDSATRHIEDQIGHLDDEITEQDTGIDKLEGQLPSLHDLYLEQQSPLLTTLNEFRGKHSEIMTQISHFKDTPAFLGEVMVRTLREQLRPIDAEIRKTEARIEAIKLKERRHREKIELGIRRAEWRKESLKARKQNFNRAIDLLENLKEPKHRGPFHDNKLFFNHAVWLSLSAGEVLSLARRRNKFRGEQICELIDPTPVAITGNYVGYRWRFEDPIRSQMFKKQHVEPFANDPTGDLKNVEADIAIPTGGVFGEAVLGEAVSAEKIDLSRFWNWQDSPIPILPTAINPLNSTQTTMQDLDAKPGDLDETSAKMDKLAPLPDPSGFGALAQTMQAQVFRDMSGQNVLGELAKATTDAASSSEQNAGKIASENLRAGLDFVSGMADKALTAASIAAAPETGGASLLGGMVKSKNSGGASLLGGVLNADGAGSRGGLLNQLGGSKGAAAEAIGKMVIGAEGTTGGGVGSGAEKPPSKGPDSAEGKGENSLPPSQTEPKEKLD